MQVNSGKLDKDFSVRIFDTIRAVDEKIWNSIHSDIPFYQRHAFLSLIESVHGSLSYRYVILYLQEQPVAAVYTQLLDFSYRNLVNYTGDHHADPNIYGIRRFIAQKTTKLLNVGDVFFTGDKGIIAADEMIVIERMPQLFNLLKSSFTSGKPSAYLIANIYLQDQARCIDFCNKAFHSFNTEPDLFMHIPETWKSFEDYMNALSSKYRVRARKVFAVSGDIEQRALSLAEIKESRGQLEKLYNNVVNHVAFNMATLNIDFFEGAKALYEEKCTILGYYLKGELVSFVCLFHVEPGLLHVHYIGLNYDINKAYKLYNRMLLDFVRFAIEHDIKTVHFGRTATEIKTTIGAEPKLLQAYLKMNNALFNAALPSFLKRIKPPEYVVRNPFR